MQVAKWGNSLAVRIPADVVRELGLKEGDDVAIVSANQESIELRRDGAREEALARIRKFARSLPPGWKFDREEANARGPDTD